MLYMIIGHFKNEDPLSVYHRFRDRGLLLPTGLICISSWINEEMNCCYQIIKTNNEDLINEWIGLWTDLVDFEVHKLITLKELDEAIKDKLGNKKPSFDLKNTVKRIGILNTIYAVGWLLFIIACLLPLTKAPIQIAGILSIFCAVIFIACFIYEVFLLYKERKQLIKSLLIPVSSLVSIASIFIAKLTIINFTKVEPETFSSSSVFLSLIFGFLIWIVIIIIILFLVYFVTLLFTYLKLLVTALFYPIFYPIVDYLFEYVFHKQKVKLEAESQLSLFSRALGAGLLAGYLLFGLLSISLTYSIPLIHMAEQIIVQADYRSSEQMTECNNLQSGQRGLLLKNKKINVAEPQISGGYHFTTKPCLFQ